MDRSRLKIVAIFAKAIPPTTFAVARFAVHEVGIATTVFPIFFLDYPISVAHATLLPPCRTDAGVTKRLVSYHPTTSRCVCAASGTCFLIQRSMALDSFWGLSGLPSQHMSQ
jgi:hypothetical protein